MEQLFNTGVGEGSKLFGWLDFFLPMEANVFQTLKGGNLFGHEGGL